MLWVLTPYAVKVGALQMASDCAGSAVANAAAIHFDDRRDFSCRAGEEDFIGTVNLVAGQSFGA